MEDGERGVGRAKKVHYIRAYFYPICHLLKPNHFSDFQTDKEKKILYGNRHVEKPENHPNKGRDNSRIK